MVELNKVKFEITNNNSVKAYIEKEEGTTIKTITMDEFISIINSSNISANKDSEAALDYKTNILPHLNSGCIQTKRYKDGREYFVMLREAKVTEFNYFDTVYKINTPSMLFAIVLANNIIQGVKIAAVKSKNKVITEKTEIFSYPFSNVSNSTSYACLGANRVSNIKFKSTSQLHSIPDMILSMPNNNDSYGNKNLSGLDYRPLLEKLQNISFPDKWLKSTGMKYEEWFKEI